MVSIRDGLGFGLTWSSIKIRLRITDRIRALINVLKISFKIRGQWTLKNLNVRITGRTGKENIPHLVKSNRNYSSHTKFTQAKLQPNNSAMKNQTVTEVESDHVLANLDLDIHDSLSYRVKISPYLSLALFNASIQLSDQFIAGFL